MFDDFNIEMIEDADIVKAIETLPYLVQRYVIGQGIADAARVVRDQAKINVPIRTGALYKSIHVRIIASRIYDPASKKIIRVQGSSAQVVAGRQKGARHGHLVELGTVKSRPHPFLRPALMSTQEAQMAALTAGARKRFTTLQPKLNEFKISRNVARLFT